jgi:hypothetical protein
MVMVLIGFAAFCICALMIGYRMDLAYIKSVGANDYKRHWDYYDNIDVYARKVYWTTQRFVFAKALNRLQWTCWTDLVMWATYGNMEALKGALFGVDDCKEESFMFPFCECMCGKFSDGAVAKVQSATCMMIAVPRNPWELTGEEYVFQDLLRVREGVKHG